MNRNRPGEIGVFKSEGFPLTPAIHCRPGALKIRRYLSTLLARIKISSYICTPEKGLTHGVMVTQQILVLSFQVRILVGQQNRGKASGEAGAFYMENNKKR